MFTLLKSDILVIEGGHLYNESSKHHVPIVAGELLCGLPDNHGARLGDASGRKWQTGEAKRQVFHILSRKWYV